VQHQLHACPTAGFAGQLEATAGFFHRDRVQDVNNASCAVMTARGEERAMWLKSGWALT